MTQIEHLREQAQHAERLARNMLDVTVNRLLEASAEYQRLANDMECRARADVVVCMDINEETSHQRLSS